MLLGPGRAEALAPQGDTVHTFAPTAKQAEAAQVPVWLFLAHISRVQCVSQGAGLGTGTSADLYFLKRLTSVPTYLKYKYSLMIESQAKDEMWTFTPPLS